MVLVHFFPSRWRFKNSICNIVILSLESTSFNCHSKSCSYVGEIALSSNGACLVFSTFHLFHHIASWGNEFSWFSCWGASSSDELLPTAALNDLVTSSGTSTLPTESQTCSHFGRKCKPSYGRPSLIWLHPYPKWGPGSRDSLPLPWWPGSPLDSPALAEFLNVSNLVSKNCVLLLQF